MLNGDKRLNRAKSGSEGKYGDIKVLKRRLIYPSALMAAEPESWRGRGCQSSSTLFEESTRGGLGGLFHDIVI